MLFFSLCDQFSKANLVNPKESHLRVVIRLVCPIVITLNSNFSSYITTNYYVVCCYWFCVCKQTNCLLFRKELHDNNKDSISCAGSGCSGSTVSAHMESSVEANNVGHDNVGLDNDAFENSGELSPSTLRFDLISTYQLLKALFTLKALDKY